MRSFCLKEKERREEKRKTTLLVDNTIRDQFIVFSFLAAKMDAYDRDRNNQQRACSCNMLCLYANNKPWG